jgi:hypothetical protein
MTGSNVSLRGYAGFGMYAESKAVLLAYDGYGCPS